MPRMENTRPAGTMMENSWTSWSASRRHACNNAREINQSEYIDIANFFLGSTRKIVPFFFFFFDKSVYLVTRFVTTHLSSTYTYISPYLPANHEASREANWIRWKGKLLLSTGEKREEERDKFILPLRRVNFFRRRRRIANVIKIRPAAETKAAS